MAAALDEGVQALGRLLDGVNDPVRAIQFLNNLLQAVSDVMSIQGDVKDAKFLRELINSGFEYIKLNPTGPTDGSILAINPLLDMLWQQGNTAQARGSLYEFLYGFSSQEERIKQLSSAPVRVEFTSISFPKILGLGSVIWSGVWGLSGASSQTNGYLIQRIRSGINVNPSSSANKMQPRDFWEAWKVVNGEVLSVTNSKPPAIDTFITTSKASGTSGNEFIEGQAIFLQGYQLSPDWKPGDKGGVPTSGSLPSTYNRPKRWTNNANGNGLYRLLEIIWDSNNTSQPTTVKPPIQRSF